MIDFKLLFKLWLRSFSFKKDSFRYPTFKRIIVVFFVIPIIIIHVLITHIFLALDHVFFPAFKSKNADKSVFIIGFPRSGTSFLLNLLANNTQTFTAFRLWEMVFAPSIIQKIFYISLYKLLTKIGFPVKALIQRIDRLIFGRLEGLHDMSLLEFEEDEVLFMYLFQSAYWMFIFPELEDEHGLVVPDNLQNLNKRIKNINFYKSLIKRHLYVFNKNNKKYFLSKNPFYPIKLEGMTTVFPHSNYLIIQRPLEKIAPSVISFVNHIYQYFCTKQTNNPMREATIDFLIEWSLFLHYFKEKPDYLMMNIDFKELTRHPSNQAKEIHEWLACSINTDYEKFLDTQDEFSKNYVSKHQYDPLTEDELERIRTVKHEIHF